MEKVTAFAGNQFTFVHESFKEDEETLDLFLGPITDEERASIVFFNQADWSDIAVAVGLFPSRSQARKNGFCGELDLGLTNQKQRKGQFIKRDIWILNRFG